MTTCPFHQVRPGLPALTERIGKLPVDERGYPIPFFVAYVDGKPDFRVADPKKIVRCVREKLCWTCGQPLGRYLAFGIGPMCCINRTSSEPPSHHECMEWAVRGCPFLSKPNMVRREDEFTEMNKGNVAGIMIERNPGVTCIWVCKEYRLIRDGRGGVLFRIGDNVAFSWWREGRLASRVEVMSSMSSGLPLLEAACENEVDRIALELQRQAAMKYVPL